MFVVHYRECVTTCGQQFLVDAEETFANNIEAINFYLSLEPWQRGRCDFSKRVPTLQWS